MLPAKERPLLAISAANKRCHQLHDAHHCVPAGAQVTKCASTQPAGKRRQAASSRKKRNLSSEDSHELPGTNSAGSSVSSDECSSQASPAASDESYRPSTVLRGRERQQSTVRRQRVTKASIEHDETVSASVTKRFKPSDRNIGP